MSEFLNISLFDLLYPISSIFYVSLIALMWFVGDITLFIKMTLNNPKWLKRDEYEHYLETIDQLATYPEFLHSNYPSIITHILSCPICMIFWMTLVSTILMANPLCIFILPINYFISLFIYVFIKKILE